MKFIRVVLRGGVWFNDAGNLRTAFLLAIKPGLNGCCIGFRLS